MTKKCYADDCKEPAKHELRYEHGDVDGGELAFEMCTTHYLEALEHGAHITVVWPARWDSCLAPFFADVDRQRVDGRAALVEAVPDAT